LRKNGPREKKEKSAGFCPGKGEKKRGLRRSKVPLLGGEEGEGEPKVFLNHPCKKEPGEVSEVDASKKAEGAGRRKGNRAGTPKLCFSRQKRGSSIWSGGRRGGRDVAEKNPVSQKNRKEKKQREKEKGGKRGPILVRQ